MKTATLLKKKLSRKQWIIVGAIAAIPILAGIVYGAFFLLQQTAISSRANEEAPSNVVVEPVGENNVKIKWNTGVENTPIIQYGTEPVEASLTKVAVSGTSSTSHSIDINSLEPGTYYFQIKVGDTVYNNDGLFWSFTVGAKDAGSPTTEPLASPSAELSITVVPTPTQEASPSASITPTTEPVASPSASICSSSDCAEIQKNLGTQCNTQDYVKCIFNSGPNPSPTTGTSGTTSTPAPTGNQEATPTNAPSTSKLVSAQTRLMCRPKFLQANSCSSWVWSAMADIDETCSDTYTKYFVQCKSNSFGSNDAATWYCNKTVTSNLLTLPCDEAPTPGANQSVFCRVRSETAEGGSTTATDWIYSQSTCPAYTSGNIDACRIKYLQSNDCRNWIWDLVNTTDANCSKAFSRYFFQCTDNGNFDYITTTPTPVAWYCNTTSVLHYLALPCYNAQTPDGSDVTCRVRAEDAYGGDDHATAWTTRTYNNCPTSTPTLTPTTTPTFTPTPTATPTFTPTPTP